MKKILIAPDKFKGTISASRVAEIVAEALREKLPESVEIIRLPLADGGEGTLAALNSALNGTIHKKQVHGPLGDLVDAEYALAGKTAVLEMASASGMALLPRERLNPLKTGTFGTGELIADALGHGAREFLIGIGGSATIDGGCGMAEALGGRFFDRDHNPVCGLCGEKLAQIAFIDRQNMNPLLKESKIRIAADVSSPLLGPDGAVAVYGPQKGATPEMMPVLERGLENLLQSLHEEDRPGDGAAGGLGFGLRIFCEAAMESGAKLAMETTGFYRHLSDASLVITGEGCTDSQTEAGKICGEIALACQKVNVPCILLSGGIKSTQKELQNCFSGVFASGIGRANHEEILRHAEEDLSCAARSVAILLNWRER